ncbi:uncharacterized protein LOC112500954 isoform X1 [Cynara cardunculus var. scolymus]|uniref:Uncharacterized protein n=1 Tax=Cynara cardunculus var. scolymus TaxID=59895 RepID=A0A103Y425_CYNCS|nr:uncharacterized protein LOC112500954 isoform X1 [Cynara cardunculus var. scolymus]KVI02141.1 hypothetical protein Ccrd_019571 [Cynara cardunculus var. scolymus]
MILSKTLRSHQIRTLSNLSHTSLSHLPLNPKQHHTEPHLISSTIPTSIFSRNISLSSQFRHEFATQNPNHNSKKPLEAFFTEAIGLSKPDTEDGHDEKKELKKSLQKLEEELRRSKKDPSKETTTSSNSFSKKPLETLFTEAIGLSKIGEEIDINEIENDGRESQKGLKTLSSFFLSNDQRGKLIKESKKLEESMDFKQLSSDMAEFAAYLHSKGYLKTANFLQNNKFDVSCFENSFGRDYLKFAAENFARDHREIHKWLPDKDLKTVAQFGCPSLGRKNIFSAKSMRLFYGIQEETVCNKCVLKESCKFVNQSVWKKGAKNMDLIAVMRVVTLYGLEAIPTQLEVPDDVKNAVNRLLKEVVRLSKIES